MTKVVIDMSMSLDGFVAGPDDGKAIRSADTAACTLRLVLLRRRGVSAIRCSGPRRAPTATRSSACSPRAAPSSSGGGRTRSPTVGAAATR